MNKVDIITSDREAEEAVRFLKSDERIYSRISTSLGLIGDFNRIANAHLYENNRREGKIELVLEDKNKDIFVITAKSPYREDLSIIKKYTDKGEMIYDLSLLKNKKCDINEGNIDLCRVCYEYGTKHGRIMTDKKTFLTLFLGEKNAYQLLCNFENQIPMDVLLMDINMYEKKPTFKEFVESLGNVLPPYEIDNISEINAYTEFVKVGSVKVKEENKGNAKRKGTL